MEFSEFSELLGQWCSTRSPTPLDCWIDDANARVWMLDEGVRCSIDLLDPFDATDSQRLDILSTYCGASLACGCHGVMAVDPDTNCVVLIATVTGLCDPGDLLSCLESLANQRAALLSLMHTLIRTSAPDRSGRMTLNFWRPGV